MLRTLLLIVCSALPALGCRAQNPAATVVYRNGDNGYGAWTDGTKWHYIVVTLTGATEQTRLTFAGKEAKCRFWLDNLKVRHR